MTRGRLDTSVAESGIALALRMNPLFSRILENELVVTDVHDNMFFDLRRWFQAYEPELLGDGIEEIRWNIRYGDRLPINRAERFSQIVALLGTTPPVISTAEARRQLEKLGWEFSLDEAAMMAEVLSEQGKIAQEQADAVSGRINQDIGALGGGS